MQSDRGTQGRRRILSVSQSRLGANAEGRDFTCKRGHILDLALEAHFLGRQRRTGGDGGRTMVRGKFPALERSQSGVNSPGMWFRMS